MKRAFDAFVAGLGLVVLSPLLIFISLVIKVYDRGPVLYKARRVGRNGFAFHVYKFRTMVVGADKLGERITRAKDKRVTPLGKLLRRFKLDELPQLLNVLKGEMSFVGPRPEDARIVEGYSSEQRKLLSFRPGITSPASLRFRSEEAFLSGPAWEKKYIDEILPKKLAYDIAYFSKRSFLTDLKLILKTLWLLLSSNQTSHSSNYRDR